MGDSQGHRRYLAGKKERQSRFRRFTDGFYAQGFEDAGGAFYQGVVEFQPGGLQVTDRFNLQIHFIFMTDSINNVFDIIVNGFYHFVRIAANFKS